jgi:hypothetical protein
VSWSINADAVEKFVNAVKSAFPNKTLSADVFSSVEGMYSVGQVGSPAMARAKSSGMPAQVNIIMPMTYSFLGQGGSDDIQALITGLMTAYPNKKIIACARGWNTTDSRSAGLINDLKYDLHVMQNVHVYGYSLFTYESLLQYAESNGYDSTLVSIKAKIGY